MNEGDLRDLLAKLDRLEQEVDAISEAVSSTRQLVGPFGVPFPDGTMLTQTIHGQKYFIDPSDLIMAPQMVVYRQWEADLSNLFRSLCTPDTVIADVGANFGYFTILGASLIGQSGKGKVFSYEPNPKLAALLRRNIEINWSLAPITFAQCAIAAQTNRMLLNIPDKHGANASLSSFVEGQDGESLEVQVKSLDECLPPEVTLDVLKIDVEGHEFSVLRGAKDVVSRSDGIAIIMEWSRTQMDMAGVDPTELKSLLPGFACFEISGDGVWQENRRDHAWLLEQNYTNIFLTRG